MENRFKLADSFIGSLSPVADLYNNIWSENSTCMLHAPRDLDKSSLAVDIALALTARDIPVFYLTARDIPVFYLTGSRLNAALLDKMKGNSRLYIHQSEFSAPDDPEDFADIVFKDLEDAIVATGAKVFIIDSLSRIASLSFGRNATPAFLMKRFMAMQVRHKVSFLVIAHDSTKAATRALVNLADSELTMTIPEEQPVEEKKTETPEVKVGKPAETTPKKPTGYNDKSPIWRVPHSYSPFWDGNDNSVWGED